jgi:hypothetical protein
VAVITPKGMYSDESDFDRIAETTDPAKADARRIDDRKTFKQEKLSGIVEIEYHKYAGVAVRESQRKAEV